MTRLLLLLLHLLHLAVDNLINLVGDVVVRSSVPLESLPGLHLPVVLHQPVGRLLARPHGEGEEDRASRADPASSPPVKQKPKQINLLI